MPTISEMLGMLRLLEGGRPDTRTTASQQKANLDAKKYTINKLHERYSKATTASEKENIRRITNDYYNGLSRDMQFAIKPLLSGGPADPMIKKREQYKAVKGDRPKSVITYEDDPAGFALQTFAQDDYDRGYHKFMLGEDRPKATVLGLAPNAYAKRTEQGKISIIDDKALGYERFAAENDTTVANLVGNNGRHYTKKSKTVIMNNKVYDASNYYDLETRKSGTDLSFKQTLGTSPRELPKDLKDFMTAIAGAGQDYFSDIPENLVYQSYISFFKDGIEERTPVEITKANDYLSAQFPGYSFILKSKDETKGFVWKAITEGVIAALFQDEQYYIKAIKGQPIPMKVKDAQGNVRHVVYYADYETNSLFNDKGLFIPDPFNFLLQKGIDPNAYFQRESY